MNIVNISPAFLHQLIELVITIIVAIGVNMLFRSYIKLPKNFESRHGKKYVVIFRNIVTIILGIVATHIVLLILNINVTPLLASIGLIGVVTAIIANSVFSDLVAGFFLLSQTDITVGDYINIGGTNIVGIITNIGIKNLSLRGDDGALIIVPNGQVRTFISYPNGRIHILIDIPTKLNTMSIDDILSMHAKIIESMKQDKNITVYDESKLIGVKSMDIAAGVVTVAVMIVCSIQSRLKVEPAYRYQVIKKLYDVKE